MRRDCCGDRFYKTANFILDKVPRKGYTVKSRTSLESDAVMKFGLAQWESVNRVRLGAKQH